MLDSRNTLGRCRYHPVPRIAEMLLVPAAATVDGGALPDAADQKAVNLWLRQLAIRALAAAAAAGPLSPSAFDLYRRSILALQDESRLLEPSSIAGETVLDEVARRLKALP